MAERNHRATFAWKDTPPMVKNFEKATRRLDLSWRIVKAGNWIEDHSAEIVLVACVVAVIALLYGLTRWN